MADVFKRNAAAFIARFEYKFQIWAIEAGTGLLFFFVLMEERHQNILGIVVAIFIALTVGSFVREFIFSRLLLKKLSDEQLKALWLKYGGF